MWNREPASLEDSPCCLKYFLGVHSKQFQATTNHASLVPIIHPKRCGKFNRSRHFRFGMSSVRNRKSSSACSLFKLPTFRDRRIFFEKNPSSHPSLRLRIPNVVFNSLKVTLGFFSASAAIDLRCDKGRWSWPSKDPRSQSDAKISPSW